MVEKAKGQYKDLSVAVILDSSDSVEDYTENVKKLVANSIGVAQDKITVEMLPFKKLENETDNTFAQQKEIMNNMQGAETMRLIILAVAALAVMLILFAIIKTLRKKDVVVAAAEGASMEEGSIDYYAGEEIIPEPLANDVNFDTKDTNLTQLETYIDKSPESVAQLLRNWLSEDYGR
jgi:flagellar M-ring protein FliF